MAQGKKIAEFVQEVSEETNPLPINESAQASIVSYDWISTAIACSTDKYMINAVGKFDQCMEDL